MGYQTQDHSLQQQSMESVTQLYVTAAFVLHLKSELLIEVHPSHRATEARLAQFAWIRVEKYAIMYQISCDT